MIVRFDSNMCNLGSKPKAMRKNNGTWTSNTFGVQWTYVTDEGNVKKVFDLIRPGCSCTANFTVSPLIKIAGTELYRGQILGKYTPLEGEEGLITKQVYVHVNDGNPLTILNANKIEQYNPEKQTITLTIHVDLK